MEKYKPIIFYIMFFLFVLTFSSFANGYDYDFWARLIAGMGFIQTGQVLKQDFLSYTPTHTWFDHEWGSGVIFYLTQHLFSSAGLLLLQAGLVFLIFFTVSKIIKLRGVQTTSAYNFLFYFVAFNALIINFNEPVRCQMFSFLLFAVFLYILELARKGNDKPLWLLPFIMIFWNNLHGGCISGIGLILLYIVGEALNRAPVKKYILAIIPTTLVLLINPWGLSYISFLAKATTMKRPYIMEWWGLFSPFYLKGFIPFKIFALVLLSSELIIVIKSLINKSFSFRNADKTKFLVLAATLFLAIEHVKMVPFFAITASCFLYDDFYIFLNSIVLKLRQMLKLDNLFGEAFATKKEIAIYAVILIFVLTNLRLSSFSPIVKASRYPLREVEFVKINNIKGDLLVNFGLGSYAAYKLYPNNKIFMDGRYEEVYDDSLLPMIRNFALMNKGWEELLNKFPPDVIIMENYYEIYNYLKTSNDWKLVYKGDIFGVFVRAKDAKKVYKQPPSKIDYYKQTAFDTDIDFKNHLN